MELLPWLNVKHIDVPKEGVFKPAPIFSIAGMHGIYIHKQDKDAKEVTLRSIKHNDILYQGVPPRAVYIKGVLEDDENDIVHLLIGNDPEDPECIYGLYKIIKLAGSTEDDQRDAGFDLWSDDCAESGGLKFEQGERFEAAKEHHAPILELTMFRNGPCVAKKQKTEEAEL